MKQWLSILVLSFVLSTPGCVSVAVDDNPSGKILFNRDWEFMIDSSGYASPDQMEEQGPGHPDWEKVSLPHTPRIEPMVVNDQWQGTCWYRKSFRLEEKWAGKRIFIRFEGAMNVAEVWVNGVKKITHHGGYLPFVTDMTEEVATGSNHTILVRLNNEDNPVTGPKPLDQLDFNMYGGLYRDVFLLIKNPVHITDEQHAGRTAGGGIFVSFPEVSEDEALVEVRTHVINSGDTRMPLKISHTLKWDGMTVAGSAGEVFLDKGTDTTLLLSMKVTAPLLWSPGTPNLYDLNTQVLHRKTVLDEQTIRVGIRRFEFRGNRLYINGEESFLRGVNRHQEYPFIGYALSNNAQYRDAVKIKEAGLDYVRLSHYPHSPSFMDACDELGIITIDAILGWQYYREDEKFKQQVVQTCRDMIRRDRNHPSVLAWEVSLNESWMPEPFIDSLVKAAKEEYPYGDCYTAGWQTHGFDIYLQARQHRLGHPPRFPDKPYIVSEYGDWEYYAMNAGLNQDDWADLMESERSSRQLPGSGEKNLLQQATNIQEAHNDNFNTPAFADGYWVMFDYNRGYADDLESSGIMGIFRVPKYSYYFFKSQRSAGVPLMGRANEPMVRIASYWNENSLSEIRVFSNCEEVELLLNGNSLGARKPDRDRISDHLNHPPFTFRDVPFTPGTLTAVGTIGGKEASRHRVTTPGGPARIILEVDLSDRPLESGVNDVVFVQAKVVDADNTVIPAFSGKVGFELAGDARIIGPVTPAAEAGIASVLLMAGKETGELIISAYSGELKSEPVIIEVK